ncbi:MAG: nucleotidyltransferase family protein [Ruminococcus sp.]|nr:nucleotidyltransferase family protein [Ruminococcus sp.]
MNSLNKDLIYLLSCAVNGITPDRERVQDMDLEQLYRLAKFHTVRGAVCIALERAGIEDKQFNQAYKKAVRKNIYLDMERTVITAEFDTQGIWYMPLKGSVLKELYPENGMREMSDNDVLFDADRQEQVKEIMLANGYTAEHYGQGNHDVYMKPPVLNFELHTALFGEAHAEPLYQYYADTKRLLHRDEGNGCGCHFSDEDFYVFMTAHEWKHYNGSGTGIRSLLDCYVYCREKGDKLDWKYITEQCILLEIADFEQERRKLAIKVFSSDTLPNLTENELEMLMCYLTAGTYGTFENGVRKKLKEQSKAGYILRQMFPTVGYMKKSVKFVDECPVLYPVGIVYRWGRIIVKRRDYLKRTVKTVKKYKK